MKLFIYPEALPHSHDLISHYWNTTPMSIQGIKDYFNVVTNPAEADFYYCGQISDGTLKDINITNFKHLKGNEHKHIVTIEGDWVNESMPEELYGCIFTGNGMKDWQKAYLYCSRPCMSKLLIHLVKNNVVYNITYPNIKSFGFRGVMDSRRTRARIYQLVVDSNIPHQIEFTQGWLGSADVAANNTIQQYARIMKDNIVSLCPRGEGEDTIRFYESCFFGRVPVIIGRTKIMNEDLISNKFYYKIDPNATDTEIKKSLLDIYNTPLEELIERGKQARVYFDTVIRDYFKDPTANFIQFLKFHEVI